MKSVVAGNPLLITDRRSKIPCDETLWQNMNIQTNDLRQLMVKEFFDENAVFKNLNELNNILYTALSRQNYNLLKKIFVASVENVKKNGYSTGSPDPETILAFLNRF
jgi:hypothetical protein